MFDCGGMIILVKNGNLILFSGKVVELTKMIVGMKNRQFNVIAHIDKYSKYSKPIAEIVDEYPEYFYGTYRLLLKEDTGKVLVNYNNSIVIPNGTYILIDTNRNIYIISEEIFDNLFYVVDDERDLNYV